MRPANDTRQAILKAAVELTTVARSPTLRELAARACVGQDAARRTVDNMKRAGWLIKIRERRVDYRNRPVAEYAPKEGVEVSEATAADWRAVFGAWRKVAE